MNSDAADRRPPLWLAWLLLPMLGWWLYGLFDLDEGFYAAIVSNMLRTGDWITPHVHGEPWFEKPILLYWLAAPFVKLFGLNFGARLPSILSAIGLLCYLYRWVSRESGALAAQWTVVVCGTSLFFIAVSRMMMTDSIFVACLTVAVCEAWSRRGLSAWTGLFVGLAVLAKGPVAILLLVGWLIVYSALNRKWIGGSFLGVFSCLAAMLVVVSLWYVPCYLVNRDVFVQKFLIEQNWQRFLGGDKAHKLPFFAGLLLYPLVLLVGFFPWCIRLPAVVNFALKRKDSTEYKALVWAATVFGFFFIGGSKLPHYIAPCIPPLSIAVGCYFAQVGRPIILRRLIWACFLLGQFVNGIFVLYYNGKFGVDSHEELHRLVGIARGKKLVSYQLTRRDKALGTGQLKVQETSHPSIEAYANQIVDDQEELPGNPLPADEFFVLTRVGRVNSDTIAQLEKKGFEVHSLTVSGSKFYQLYLLRRRN